MVEPDPDFFEWIPLEHTFNPKPARCRRSMQQAAFNAVLIATLFGVSMLAAFLHVHVLKTLQIKTNI